jgi:formate dehydrogenase maturation protein FdhE
MSFSKLLEALLAQLINTIGPALIELILNWLKSLNAADTKELAKNISESLKKSLDERAKTDAA